MDSTKMSRPWWEEELHSKQQKQQKSEEFIDSEGWKFLRGGIDDSRKGLPPLFEAKSAYYKSSKGIGPHITSNGAAGRSSTSKSKKVHKARPTEKFVSNFDRRRETIKDIETELQSHPLALYSHLSESIDPNLYEDIVRILDPEMKLAMDNNLAAFEDDDSKSLADNSGSRTSFQNLSFFYGQQQQHLFDEPSSSQEGAVRNPYLWDTGEGDEGVTTAEQKKTEQPKIQSQMQDEEILQVTKQFCEWVASMGGETNNIDEATILSLFASGYDTKPTLPVPIQVVELNSIPPELRALAGVLDRQVSSSRSDSSKSAGQAGTSVDGYKPNFQKHRYGAWYLNPKTWKKLPVGEPLKDPNDQTDNEISETKKKSLELDYDLASMQGTRLFMQFVNEKDTRKPEFLENVERIQLQKQQEQERKQLVESAKQKKLLSKRA